MIRLARRGWPVLIGLGVLIAIPYIASPYLVSLATLMMILAILGSSVNLLAGQAGLVSVGHAGIAAAGGYGLAWAAIQGYGFGAQLATAVLVTLIVSAIYGVTTARTNGIVFLMVTLALGMVIYGLTLRWSTVTGGQNGLTGISRPSSVAAWWQYYYLVGAVLVASLVALRALRRSPFGLAMRAVRDSEARAASLGYSVVTVKIVATTVSGIFAGLAGVLAVWHTQFISPSSAAFSRSATSIVVVIIGGVGSLFGPLIGSAVVVGTEHWLGSYVTRWPTLLGSLFIAAVLFAPSGVTGVMERIRGSRRGRRAESAPSPSRRKAQGLVGSGS